MKVIRLEIYLERVSSPQKWKLACVLLALKASLDVCDFLLSDESNNFFWMSSAGTSSAYDSQRKWEKKVFITYEIWIFILQKRMDSLQEAFIHPPEPCEARFITDERSLLLTKTPALPHWKAWRGQDNF